MISVDSLEDCNVAST